MCPVIKLMDPENNTDMSRINTDMSRNKTDMTRNNTDVSRNNTDMLMYPESSGLIVCTLYRYLFWNAGGLGWSIGKLEYLASGSHWHRSE